MAILRFIRNMRTSELGFMDELRKANNFFSISVVGVTSTRLDPVPVMMKESESQKPLLTASNARTGLMSVLHVFSILMVLVCD